MSNSYEKDIAERTTDRILISLGILADVYIDYLSKEHKQQAAKIAELESAFDEVCHDIRNYAPKYVHPLEAALQPKEVIDSE